MNRQARRRQERNNKTLDNTKLINFVENRLYNFADIKAIVAATEKEIQQKYEAIYPLAIVNALRAEPFSFGKKRISEVLKLLYDNIEGLRLGTISVTEMVQVANDVGVQITYDKDTLHINMSDNDKKGTRTNENCLAI
jgi:hypothetical protein